MRRSWNDFEGVLENLELLRRNFGGLLNEEATFFVEPRVQAAFPRISIWDLGEAFQVQAVVPGLRKEELKLSLNKNVLTLSGERTISLPENYSVQRRERGDLNFSRSISLPGPIDPEKVKAQVKNGLLTIHLAKAEASLPKQILVEAA